MRIRAAIGIAARQFKALWLTLAAVILGAALAAWQFIPRAVAEYRDEMLFSLYLRAESLAWSAEGVARYLGHRHGRDNLSKIFAEIGRQPGVAWLAIVDAQGRILADSNAELAGKNLYSPAEMRALAPAAALHGRFSPDDHNIFETWKIFSPGRLNGQKHGGTNRIRPQDQAAIFVALDAADFHADMRDYARQLWIMGALILLFGLCFCSLIFFIRRWRSSRRHLRDARALSAQVAANFPAPLLVTDVSGSILLSNTPADSLFGPDQKHIQTLPGLDWGTILRAIGPGKPMVGKEIDFTDQNGGIIPVSLSGAAIVDSFHKVSGYLISLTDLTEIKSLQRKLAETRRLSALGHLAAGVAHEIRNPLGSICGYASYLKNRLQTDPMAQSAAALLEEEAQRLNSALCDLLNVVKIPGIKPRQFSVRYLLDKIAALAKPDFEAKNISLQILAPARGEICADYDRLLQAMLNLALNASQAAPDGGHIEIEAVFLNNKANGIPASMAKNDGVWRISVKDDGPGIPERIMKQLFTPYFTTRANGTGLGLALVKQTIDAHGGVISAANQPQHGAVFTIFLPAAPEAV